jgi:hypothetical protein
MGQSMGKLQIKRSMDRQDSWQGHRPSLFSRVEVQGRADLQWLDKGLWDSRDNQQLDKGKGKDKDRDRSR